MSYNPKNTYVAIMAGGIGSRFWPASREAMPKQFLDILGVGKSLLRLTFERFLQLCPADHIYIVTNRQYTALVKEHLPELPDHQIIGEPSRNNTAPCVAYSSFKMIKRDPDANFVVAPSDHIILKETAFLEKIKTALEFTSQNDALCTLGITPTRADTGYGYIKYEVRSTKYDVQRSGEICKVEGFKEKPDADTARLYYTSGDYLWNAGIFVWSARSVLGSFKKHANEIYTILEAGMPYYNTSGENDFIQEAYPTTPSISVDYAIMENADNIYTLPADIGWSDLGTWVALHEEVEKDENNNAVNAGATILDNVRNCLLRVPKNKLLVTKDLDGYIVVDEEDVLMIYPKSKEQEIKSVTEKVREKYGNPFL